MKKHLWKALLLIPLFAVVYGVPQLFPGTVEEEASPLPLPPAVTETATEEEETPLTPVVEKVYLDYLSEQEVFELPLQGATAYASIDLNFRETPEGALMAMMPQGTGFTILEDHGEWWLTTFEGTEGYVFANYCMLNLPDVLPSAIYENHNGSASVFHSSFVDIPEITGEKLYETYHFNERLDQMEFTMVVLYQTAIKIAQVQQKALNNGETLIIVELFRPASTQKKVVEAVTALSQSNATVRAGLTTAPWSTSWFISTGVSNHQKGFAIDTSLGKVLATEVKYSGDYQYVDITDYEEYTMPTQIHELSYHSASHTRLLTEIQVPISSPPVVEDTSPPEEGLGTDSPETGDNTEENNSGYSPEEGSGETANPDTTPPETAEAPVETPEAETPVETPVTPEAESLSFSGSFSSGLLTPRTVQTLSATMTEGGTGDADSGATGGENSGASTTGQTRTEYVYGDWVRADTMTWAADRMENYFLEVDMTSIQSEWWHFNDFDNQGSGENLGQYEIIGNHSKAPLAPLTTAQGE